MQALTSVALPSLAAVPAVVLDTNVVLDWLVFGNPDCLPIVNAIEAGTWRWLVTEPMRQELTHVLGRGVLHSWAPDEARLWATWDRLARLTAATTPAGSALRLRCTDPDDQKFVDLALGAAQCLISRDRAVLKLRRRAAALGLQVLTPAQWLTATAPSH